MGRRDDKGRIRTDRTARAGLPTAGNHDDESELEPDLVVAPGHPGDYRDSHPALPALAVEVAESSLDFDRAHKGSLYAHAAVPDDRERSRWRRRGLPRPRAGCIGSLRIALSFRHPVVAPSTVAPLSFGVESIAVADLLP